MEEVVETVLSIAVETLGVVVEGGGPPEAVGSSPASVALAALTQVRNLESRITALEQENAALSAFVLNMLKAFPESEHLSMPPENVTRETLLADAMEVLARGHLESRNSLRAMAGLPQVQRKLKRPRPEGNPPSKPTSAAPAKPLPPQMPQPRRTPQ